MAGAVRGGRSRKGAAAPARRRWLAVSALYRTWVPRYAGSVEAYNATVHVLGHRLYLQPHGFEGLGPTWKRANLTELSVTEARNHEAASLTDLGSRALDTSDHLNERDDAILRVADAWTSKRKSSKFSER